MRIKKFSLTLSSSVTLNVATLIKNLMDNFSTCHPSYVSL